MFRAKGQVHPDLDQLANGKAKVRFLSAQPTDRQFGALAKGEGNTIVVWSCMECDSFSVVRWDQKKRNFEWKPAPKQH